MSSCTIRQLSDCCVAHLGSFRPSSCLTRSFQLAWLYNQVAVRPSSFTTGLHSDCPVVQPGSFQTVQLYNEVAFRLSSCTTGQLSDCAFAQLGSYALIGYASGHRVAQLDIQLHKWHLVAQLGKLSICTEQIHVQGCKLSRCKQPTNFISVDKYNCRYS